MFVYNEEVREAHRRELAEAERKRKESPTHVMFGHEPKYFGHDPIYDRMPPIHRSHMATVQQIDDLRKVAWSAALDDLADFYTTIFKRHARAREGVLGPERPGPSASPQARPGGRKRQASELAVLHLREPLTAGHG
jgi:hypothetical protein